MQKNGSNLVLTSELITSQIHSLVKQNLFLSKASIDHSIIIFLLVQLFFSNGFTKSHLYYLMSTIISKYVKIYYIIFYKTYEH